MVLEEEPISDLEFETIVAAVRAIRELVAIRRR